MQSSSKKISNVEQETNPVNIQKLEIIDTATLQCKLQKK